MFYLLQKIEVFLVRNVDIVISDRVDKTGQTNSDKRKWGYASGGSGGPPSLRSIEAPTPTPTPPTPYLNADGPLSNSTNLRVQTTQRTVSSQFFLPFFFLLVKLNLILFVY